MIRITRETDYAIVLMSRLAETPNGSICRARELAHGVGLPYPMASKILKCLAREGLLKSHRGARGGYTLARGPEEISVAEVIGPIPCGSCARHPTSGSTSQVVGSTSTCWTVLWRCWVQAGCCGAPTSRWIPRGASCVTWRRVELLPPNSI